MFNNKAFNTALVISLTWHLVCIFAVNIVVLPGKYRSRKLTSVSFLGPILQKTALDIILANKPTAVTTIYQRDLKYMHTVSDDISPRLRDDVKRHIAGLADDEMYSALGRELRVEKIIPDIVRGAEGVHDNFTDLEGSSGLAARREVLYKPDKPELPSWIDTSSPFRLELGFAVSAKGEVEEVTPVVSSGNPEVDLIGIRYLKGWRFAPLTHSSKEEQRGSIELVFEVKNDRP